MKKINIAVTGCLGRMGQQIIKSVNKKPIKDIYEYMKRMEEIKPGQSIPVDIKRDGKIIMLTVKF